MRVIAFLVTATAAAVTWTSRDALDDEEPGVLFEADQADRQLPVEDVDWEPVSEREEQRLARVTELCQNAELSTGTDWLRAAVVLQHSQDPEDHLLAHEMCIAALALGEKGAASMAAPTEDRFLRGIGRKQRFGTHFTATSPDAPQLLAETDDAVTGHLRAFLYVTPLPAPGTEFPPGE